MWDQRISKYTKDPEYWVREEYRECDCPDCEKEGHWIWLQGLQRKRILTLINLV